MSLKWQTSCETDLGYSGLLSQWALYWWHILYECHHFNIGVKIRISFFSLSKWQGIMISNVCVCTRARMCARARAFFLCVQVFVCMDAYMYICMRKAEDNPGCYSSGTIHLTLRSLTGLEMIRLRWRARKLQWFPRLHLPGSGTKVTMLSSYACLLEIKLRSSCLHCKLFNISPSIPIAPMVSGSLNNWV